MATTSLWRVHGSIRRVILYAENENKTIEQETIEGNEGDVNADIETVINYISRNDATAGRKWVAGINCSPETAILEMNETKKRDGRTDGVIAYHGYQSFAEGEVTPDQAHMIGVQLATELWGDRFEVLVATHLDKESHIHNHFVINTVPIDGGKKFHRTKQDYLNMQQLSDKLCREYGLSVIEEPVQGRHKTYDEWRDEKNGKPTFRSTIRHDIDRAIRASVTEKEFFRCMEDMGYEFKLYSGSGKRLERPSLRPQGSERFFRFDKLGDDYFLEEVLDRVIENTKNEVPFPEEERQKLRQYRKEHPPHTKLHGFAALYYHYCYELHIIVKHPASVKKVPAFLREDIRKLERLDEQSRFLGETGIETIDDLNAFRKTAESRIESLTEKRSGLKNELKKAVRNEDTELQEKLRKEITETSGQIKIFRDRLKTCDSVEERSAQMQKELDALRQQNEKGERKDELFRGSGGTGREDVPQRR